MTTDDPLLLLDTSVVSLFFRPGDTRAALYLPELQGKFLSISFVTIGELHRWAIQRKWGARRIEEMQQRLQLMVTLPYSDAVSLQWARIQTSTPKADNDAWIAACALVYGCTLVSDDSDFVGIQGIPIISHR